MAITRQDATVNVNGVDVPLLTVNNPLARAVVISLFSWRRAEADDSFDGDDPQGWWGDSWPTVDNDQIGSRLWLLSRSALTSQTLELMRGYCLEALDWMRADGVATSISCDVQRLSNDTAVASIQLTRPDGDVLSLRFNNLWSVIRNG